MVTQSLVLLSALLHTYVDSHLCCCQLCYIPMVTQSLVLLLALLHTNGDTITCAIAAHRGCSLVLITLPARCLCFLVLVVMKGTCLTWFMSSQRVPARRTRSCNKIYIALIEVKRTRRLRAASLN